METISHVRKFERLSCIGNRSNYAIAPIYLNLDLSAKFHETKADLFAVESKRKEKLPANVDITLVVR